MAKNTPQQVSGELRPGCEGAARSFFMMQQLPITSVAVGLEATFDIAHNSFGKPAN